MYSLLAMFDDSPFSKFVRWIKKKFCGCCVDNQVGTRYSIERAPEPNDVFWENLNIKPHVRYQNVAITYFATLCVIGACFGIIYGINSAKTKLAEQKGHLNGSLIQGLSVLASCVITIINMALRIVVRRFSLYEKHETYSNHNISVAMKLTIARFLNTAIVPILINRSFERWEEEGGLVSDIFYLLITISFLDSFLYLISIPNMTKKVKRFFERRKGANSTMN